MFEVCLRAHNVDIDMRPDFRQRLEAALTRVWSREPPGRLWAGTLALEDALAKADHV
jgi:hypothetical protein